VTKLNQPIPYLVACWRFLTSCLWNNGRGLYGVIVIGEATELGMNLKTSIKPICLNSKSHST